MSPSSAQIARRSQEFWLPENPPTRRRVPGMGRSAPPRPRPRPRPSLVPATPRAPQTRSPPPPYGSTGSKAPPRPVPAPPPAPVAVPHPPRSRGPASGPASVSLPPRPALASPSHALPGPEAPPRPRPRLAPAPPPARVAVSRLPRAARPELARRNGGRDCIAAWGRRRSAELGVREGARRAWICLPRCGAARSVRRSPRAGVSSRRWAGDQRGAAACWSAGGPVPGARGALRGTARPGPLCGAVFSNSPPPRWGPALPGDPVHICRR